MVLFIRVVTKKGTVLYVTDFRKDLIMFKAAKGAPPPCKMRCRKRRTAHKKR